MGAIIRKFPESIALEQCEVEKPGIDKNENARKKTDRGLSDLWASIPKSKDEDLDFNFYLEAKRATTEFTIARLPDYLREWYGISKIFRDYQKGTLGKLDQRRRFKQPWGRNHDHFAVGLSVIPLKASENTIDEIEKIIREAFERNLWLKLKSKTESDKARILKRFPTVALIVVDEEPSSKSRYPGMIAIFTVLGSTQKLTRKNTVSSDNPEEID